MPPLKFDIDTTKIDKNIGIVEKRYIFQAIIFCIYGVDSLGAMGFPPEASGQHLRSSSLKRGFEAAGVGMIDL